MNFAQSGSGCLGAEFVPRSERSPIHAVRFLRLPGLLVVCASLAVAAPVLTLDPPSGSVSGAPGTVVGWGFRLTPSPTEWIAARGAFLFFETNPGIGFYTDFIGFQGGPNGGYLAPGSGDWVQAFDPINGTGLGSYTIAPSTPVGLTNAAQLFLVYERFSDDPQTCGDCSLGTSELFTNVSISSVSAAPILTLDPPSGSLGGPPGGVVGWGFRLTPSPTEWIAATGSFLLFETNSGIGFYNDLIGLQGGPDGGYLAPGSGDWIQAFDPVNGTGLGSYSFASFIPVGLNNQAQLFVFYNRYSADPRLCGDCLLGQSQLSASVSLTSVPEPGGLALLPLGLAALVLARRLGAQGAS